MHDIDLLIRTNAGVVSVRQLRNEGVSYADVRRRCGLTPVRRGWYQSSNADPYVVQAVKDGGAFSCVSALRRYGVWVTTPKHDVHIRYPGHRKRPKRHCQPFRSNPPISAAVDTLDVAIDAAANCLKAEDLLVVLDSMLNQQMIDMADARTTVASSRFAHLHLADKCDIRAQSGLETLVRVRLRALHIKVDVQVHIDGVGWVDLLVGRRLVIETDGEASHQNFHHDRDRDLKLRELGYDVIRLTSTHVVDDWAVTLQRILVLIHRGDHRH